MTAIVEKARGLDPVAKAKLEKLLAKSERRVGKKQRKAPGHLTPAQKLLVDALKVFKRGYWIQGEQDDGMGGVCSIGAIREAAWRQGGDLEQQFQDAARLLSDAIALRVSPGGPDHKLDVDFEHPHGAIANPLPFIADWNDAPGNSARRVLAAFRQAAGLID